jgi:FMN phosphatase YigB (HAD superfamily)
MDAVRHVQQWAPTVILSDGDAVFQPRKVNRAGLWRAFDGHVLIYVRKEKDSITSSNCILPGVT